MSGLDGKSMSTRQSILLQFSDLGTIEIQSICVEKNRNKVIQGSHCPKMKMLDQAFLNSSNCKKISSVNSVIIITIS